MDNYETERVRKHIHRLVRQGLLMDKRIALFGASMFSKTILTCLQEHGFSADILVDNDSRKTGTRCLGMTVQKPEDILLPFCDKTVVLFYSPSFYTEITAELINMGYRKNHHIFAMNFRIDDSIFSFIYMSASKFRGIWWYHTLKRGHQKDCTIFIAPYTGVGDIYLAGLFFHEYTRRHGVTDYVFGVVSNACRKVAEMWGIRNIAVLPHKVSDDMISLGHATGEGLNIVTLNDGWLDDPLQWLRGYKGLHFEAVFRKFVFGFDDTVSHKLPPKKNYEHENDALFEKYALIKGKTVVLSPYSNTLFDLPDNVLTAIVAHCKAQGLVVCTNCAGTEKPVAGTTAVFFPLHQAVDFLDAAGYFIGVRSGLCDVISSSKCKKIIFYEKDGLFYKSSQYDYFSLEKMGLCDTAVELEYRDDLHDIIMEKVFKEVR